MANPVLPNLTDADADALSIGAAHDETGIIYIARNTDANSSPPLFTRLTQIHDQLKDTMGTNNQGRVVAIANPVDLRVGCFAMRYIIGSTEYSYAGDTTFTLGASVTSYLYLDAAATLKALTSGWPTGDHIKLAKVVTGATAISSIEDWRLGNWQVGTVNNWWTILPTAAVDLNGQNLSDIAELKLADATELTLAAGVITATQSAHTVDTEADAASDDLSTITAPSSGSNQLLILRGQDAARVVTIKSTGNISLIQGDFVMDATNKSLVLLYVSGVGWVELTRNPVNITQLQSDLDANGKKITGVKLINVGPGPVVATLVNGAFTYSAQWMEINPEGGVDDILTTINGGSDGDWLWLFRGSGAGKITVDASGIINLRENNETYVFSSLLDSMLLFRRSGVWYEFSRGQDRLKDFPDPDYSIWVPETVFIPGALTPNTDYAKIYVARDVLIESITAMVGTSPVGSNCIVDLLANGSSIFANDGEKANIIDGGNTDVSAVKNDERKSGTVLTIRTGASVGTTTPAADLSVTVNKRVSGNANFTQVQV